MYKRQRAYTRLAVIIPLTLTGMFILLYVTFGKFRQAGLVLAIVPLALFGGMLALNVRGMTLNVSSAVGFIAMFGLSIQNGICLLYTSISEEITLDEEGNGEFSVESRNLAVWVKKD